MTTTDILSTIVVAKDGTTTQITPNTKFSTAVLAALAAAEVHHG